ncbi:DsrE family protein [Micrococcoides hystricis]|uniref:DsrE family protein n=1 Tax=Micrococcoides hystricis TaxID=1572761 RepID=A0ABV6P8F4_9MICC
MTNSVVFQLRSADEQSILSATKSARNLLQQLPDIPVEIVCQGGSVLGLQRDTEWAEKLLEYLSKLETVKILACENALASHEVNAADLLEVVETVPAGVAHIAQRQWDGWAYLPV